MTPPVIANRASTNAGGMTTIQVSGTATLSRLRLLASGRLARIARVNRHRGVGPSRRLSIFRLSLAGGHCTLADGGSDQGPRKVVHQVEAKATMMPDRKKPPGRVAATSRSTSEWPKFKIPICATPAYQYEQPGNEPATLPMRYPATQERRLAD